MCEYNLETKGVSFFDHGMCIIDFIKQQESILSNSSNNAYTCNKYGTYKLKIVLFGTESSGEQKKNFLSSFFYLNVSISYTSNKKSHQLVSLSIDENLIDQSEIKVKHVQTADKTSADIEHWYGFGVECTLNCRNEPVVIIIGGWDQLKRSIHLFNCVTYEFTCYKQVTFQLYFNYCLNM